MQKRERQDAILRLVGTEPISRQDVLASLLAGSGFKVTQASISRDLEELGIVKVNGSYARRQNDPTFGLGLRSLTPAGDNLIVGKCDSGLASAITVRIDAAGIEEIVGTIAGDDTIFIAVREREEQGEAIMKITALFSSKG